MKILQIVKTSVGADWAFNQAKRLKESGVEIITLIPDLDGKIAKKYLENNMEVYVCDAALPIKKPWTFFKKKKKLIELVNKIKPDIIHCHFVTNIIFARLALRKINIPRVFQVPGPLHLENFLSRNLDFFTAKKNDYYIPTCEFTKNVYLKKIPNERVFLAYYGGYSSFNSDVKNKLRNEYGFSDDQIVVGMVSYFYKPKWYFGYFRGIKGHEDFIDAIKILQNKYDNLIGVIVGGSWNKPIKYEKRVHKYAKRKKARVIFTGYRKDVADIYNDFNVAVHPSHSENLGGAAESLAMCIPTVATNVGGFPDIVKNGETGYLCKKKNPKDLAEKIEKMFTDPEKAQKMANKGRELISELLDINNTANDVKDIYEKILNK